MRKSIKVFVEMDVHKESIDNLARSKATQAGMMNDWLKAQGLVSIRDLWMKAHSYA